MLELSPVDEYAHFALGRALQKQGRGDEAAPFLALARHLGQPLPEPKPGLSRRAEG